MAVEKREKGGNGGKERDESGKEGTATRVRRGSKYEHGAPLKW